MDITKIIGIGIIGAFLSVVVKGYRPELALGVMLSTGIAIFALIIPEFSKVLDEIYDIAENANVKTEDFKSIIKVIGIAYITQFSAEIAKDSGNGAIAKKIELGGKISVLIIMLPMIKNLLEAILGTLTGL